MTLNEFINTHRNSNRAAFARELGIKSQATMGRYCTGESEPSALIRDRIVAVTGGIVSIEDMHATRLEWEKSRNSESDAA